MKHYNLGGTSSKPGNTKSLISQDDLRAVKDHFARTKVNVDKAEAVVMTLGLSEFELRVLAGRLLKEPFNQ